MSIIEVDHLTKEYRLGTLRSLKQTLLNGAAFLTGKKMPEAPLFKALDDVTFSIEQGEVVGIIGHNGAGKSTLLKMLAKISTPTRGTVKMNGRIAPLIEVGAGFVPDFTGRENVYLNGAILGLSRKEIDQKFDEIVDFSEMAEFIDTPVKRYSSGMQVKLAFAVATSIEAELLIVDEVLAVGDLAFQRKCFDRIEDMIKRQGKTVLLVSHNIRQVERLCNRTILLSRGKIVLDGPSHDVCNAFYEENDNKISNQKSIERKIQSTGEVELLEITCVNAAGKSISEVVYGEMVTVAVRLKTSKALEGPIFVIGIHTTDFVYIATITSHQEFRGRTLPTGVHEVRLCLPQLPLLPGVYSLRFSLDIGDPIKNVLYGESLSKFLVINNEIQRTSPACEGLIFLSGNQWSLDVR